MDEKDSVTNFLNFANNEVFKEEPVQEETVEEEKDEKPLPFHKDPKVQRYIERQIEKATKTAPIAAKQEDVVPSDVKDVIDAFRTIVGSDTPEKVKALEALEKTLQGSDERASRKAIERFEVQQQEARQQAEQRDKQAQEDLDNYFDEIEEAYDVDLTSNSPSAKKLRSSFIDYVRKVAPKDEKGEVKDFPDMMGAYEDFTERNKPQPASRAKTLANRGMARSGDATPAAKGNSWKDVERYFATLSSN